MRNLIAAVGVVVLVGCAGGASSRTPSTADNNSSPPLSNGRSLRPNSSDEKARELIKDGDKRRGKKDLEGALRAYKRAKDLAKDFGVRELASMRIQDVEGRLRGETGRGPEAGAQRRPGAATATERSLVKTSQGADAEAQRLIREGDSRLAAGKYDEALAQYTNAEGKARDFGVKDLARSKRREALSLKRESEASQALLEQGKAKLEAGDLRGAGTDYNLARRRAPDRYTLALVDRFSKRLRERVKSEKASRKQAGQQRAANFDGLLIEAEQKAREKDFEKALEALGKARDVLEELDRQQRMPRGGTSRVYLLREKSERVHKLRAEHFLGLAAKAAKERGYEGAIQLADRVREDGEAPAQALARAESIKEGARELISRRETLRKAVAKMEDEATSIPLSASNLFDVQKQLEKFEEGANFHRDAKILKEVEATRQVLGPRIFAAATQAAKAIKEKPLEAHRFAALAASLAPEGNVAEARALKENFAKAGAKELVGQALAMPSFRSHEAVSLIEEALALDPECAEAKESIQKVRKISEQRSPSYVKDLHAQQEGRGYKVYFTVANSNGEMVPFHGKAKIEFALTAFGQRAARFGAFSHEIDDTDFGKITVGVGNFAREKYACVLPRIDFSRLIYGDGTFQDGVVRDSIQDSCYKNDYKMTVFLTLTAPGLPALKLDSEMSPPQ